MKCSFDTLETKKGYKAIHIRHWLKIQPSIHFLEHNNLRYKWMLCTETPGLGIKTASLFSDQWIFHSYWWNPNRNMPYSQWSEISGLLSKRAVLSEGGWWNTLQLLGVFRQNQCFLLTLQLDKSHLLSHLHE